MYCSLATEQLLGGKNTINFYVKLILDNIVKYYYEYVNF